MKRIKKNEVVLRLNYYDECVDINEFSEKIKEAMTKGATHVNINSEYESGSVDMDFFYERPENDEEFKARKDEEKRRTEQREQHERNQYEQLKKKFEKKIA